MRLIVSVVSHRHHDVIINLKTLKHLAKLEDVLVVCRDNLPVSKLRDYCKVNNIIYLPNEKPIGFGENNNLNFRFYQQNLEPKSSDYFLILNPDVVVTNEAMKKLKESFIKTDKLVMYAANLYLDAEYIAQDDNIRRYPKFFDFVKTFLFDDRKTMIDRNMPLPQTNKFWCSAAFLALNVETYLKLRGFNERYYLYCEDIDLCYRASVLNIRVKYLENVKALHFRQRNSKRLFTKYFFWHVQSVFIFQICKIFPSLFKSSVK